MALAFLRGKASERKLRLFAVACCRRVEHFLLTEAGRSALDTAEELADRAIDAKRIMAATTELIDDSLTEGQTEVVESFLVDNFDKLAEAVADAVTHCLLDPAEIAPSGQTRVEFAAERSVDAVFRASDDTQEQVAQAHLLLDIFGNPFRPVTADPAWIIPTVTAITRAIYVDCAFDRLLILADALEDAAETTPTSGSKRKATNTPPTTACSRNARTLV